MARRKKTTVAEPPPSWLPDWRDERQYPDPEKASGEQWAWQFLRRNQEYQKLWREIIAPYYNSKTGRFDIDAAMEMEEKKAISNPVIQKAINEKTPYTITIKSPTAIFEEKFGLHTFPPDPAKENPDISFTNNFIGYEHGPTIKNLKPVLRTPLEKYQVRFTFNLEWSIPVQIEHAKKWMKDRAKNLSDKGEIQPFKHRNRVKKYRDYLRLLDGNENNISLKEMTKIIYPNQTGTYDEKKNLARDNLPAAILLRDRNFRFIIVSKAK